MKFAEGQTTFTLIVNVAGNAEAKLSALDQKLESLQNKLKNGKFTFDIDVTGIDQLKKLNSVFDKKGSFLNQKLKGSGSAKDGMQEALKSALSVDDKVILKDLYKTYEKADKESEEKLNDLREKRIKSNKKLKSLVQDDLINDIKKFNKKRSLSEGERREVLARAKIFKDEEGILPEEYQKSFDEMLGKYRKQQNAFDKTTSTEIKNRMRKQFGQKWNEKVLAGDAAERVKDSQEELLSRYKIAQENNQKAYLEAVNEAREYAQRIKTSRDAFWEAYDNASLVDEKTRVYRSDFHERPSEYSISFQVVGNDVEQFLEKINDIEKKTRKISFEGDFAKLDESLSNVGTKMKTSLAEVADSALVSINKLEDIKKQTTDALKEVEKKKTEASEKRQKPESKIKKTVEEGQSGFSKEAWDDLLSSRYSDYTQKKATAKSTRSKELKEARQKFIASALHEVGANQLIQAAQTGKLHELEEIGGVSVKEIGAAYVEALKTEYKSGVKNSPSLKIDSKAFNKLIKDRPDSNIKQLAADAFNSINENSWTKATAAYKDSLQSVSEEPISVNLDLTKFTDQVQELKTSISDVFQNFNLSEIIKFNESEVIGKIDKIKEAFKNIGDINGSSGKEQIQKEIEAKTKLVEQYQNRLKEIEKSHSNQVGISEEDFGRELTSIDQYLNQLIKAEKSKDELDFTDAYIGLRAAGKRFFDDQTKYQAIEDYVEQMFEVPKAFSPDKSGYLEFDGLMSILKEADDFVTQNKYQKEVEDTIKELGFDKFEHQKQRSSMPDGLLKEKEQLVANIEKAKSEIESLQATKDSASDGPIQSIVNGLDEISNRPPIEITIDAEKAVGQIESIKENLSSIYEVVNKENTGALTSVFDSIKEISAKDIPNFKEILNLDEAFNFDVGPFIEKVNQLKTAFAGIANNQEVKEDLVSESEYIKSKESEYLESAMRLYRSADSLKKSNGDPILAENDLWESQKQFLKATERFRNKKTKDEAIKQYNDNPFYDKAADRFYSGDDLSKLADQAKKALLNNKSHFDALKKQALQESEQFLADSADEFKQLETPSKTNAVTINIDVVPTVDEVVTSLDRIKQSLEEIKSAAGSGVFERLQSDIKSLGDLKFNEILKIDEGLKGQIEQIGKALSEALGGESMDFDTTLKEKIRGLEDEVAGFNENVKQKIINDAARKTLSSSDEYKSIIEDKTSLDKEIAKAVSQRALANQKQIDYYRKNEEAQLKKALTSYQKDLADVMNPKKADKTKLSPDSLANMLAAGGNDFLGESGSKKLQEAIDYYNKKPITIGRGKNAQTFNGDDIHSLVQKAQSDLAELGKLEEAKSKIQQNMESRFYNPKYLKSHNLDTNVYDKEIEQLNRLKSEKEKAAKDYEQAVRTEAESALGTTPFDDIASRLESINSLKDIQINISVPDGLDQINSQLETLENNLSQIFNFKGGAINIGDSTNLDGKGIGLASLADNVSKVVTNAFEEAARVSAENFQKVQEEEAKKRLIAQEKLEAQERALERKRKEKEEKQRQIEEQKQKKAEEKQKKAEEKQRLADEKKRQKEEAKQKKAEEKKQQEEKRRKEEEERKKNPTLEDIEKNRAKNKDLFENKIKPALAGKDLKKLGIIPDSIKADYERGSLKFMARRQDKDGTLKEYAYDVPSMQSLINRRGNVNKKLLLNLSENKNPKIIPDVPNINTVRTANQATYDAIKKAFADKDLKELGIIPESVSANYSTGSLKFQAQRRDANGLLKEYEYEVSSMTSLLNDKGEVDKDTIRGLSAVKSPKTVTETPDKNMVRAANQAAYEAIKQSLMRDAEFSSMNLLEESMSANFNSGSLKYEYQQRDSDGVLKSYTTTIDDMTSFVSKKGEVDKQALKELIPAFNPKVIKEKSMDDIFLGRAREDMKDSFYSLAKGSGYDIADFKWNGKTGQGATIELFSDGEAEKINKITLSVKDLGDAIDAINNNSFDSILKDFGTSSLSIDGLEDSLEKILNHRKELSKLTNNGRFDRNDSKDLASMLELSSEQTKNYAEYDHILKVLKSNRELLSDSQKKRIREIENAVQAGETGISAKEFLDEKQKGWLAGLESQLKTLDVIEANSIEDAVFGSRSGEKIRVQDAIDGFRNRIETMKTFLKQFGDSKNLEAVNPDVIMTAYSSFQEMATNLNNLFQKNSYLKTNNKGKFLGWQEKGSGSPVEEIIDLIRRDVPDATQIKVIGLSSGSHSVRYVKDGQVHKGKVVTQEAYNPDGNIGNQYRLNITQQERYQSAMGKFFEGVQQKAVNLAQYVSGMEVIQRAWREAQEGFEFVKTLNSNLTTVGQTMNATKSELDSLGKGAIQVGRELGTSAENVMGAVTIYANANETTESILEKSKPTVMLANAAQSTTQEASTWLQAVTNQFDELEGQEKRIANSYEKISANLAIDFAEGKNALTHSNMWLS